MLPDHEAADVDMELVQSGITTVVRELNLELHLVRRDGELEDRAGGAHPGAKSIRVNRERAALTGPRGRQRFPYPRGTVIVKLGTRVGALSLVAIMRKVRAGGTPSSWRYAEYTRSRNGDGFTKVGGGQALCAGCHVSARDVQKSDSVFYRLS